MSEEKAQVTARVSAFGLTFTFTGDDRLSVFDTTSASTVYECEVTGSLVNARTRAAKAYGRKAGHWYDPVDRIAGAILEALMDVPELEEYL